MRTNGYIICYLSDKNVHLHRVVLGISEEYEVDHKNGKPYDNRKKNLRIATHSQNMRNVGLRKNNTSGVTGVDWVKKYNKWRARICKNKKDIILGLFDNFEDAVKVRKDAEEKIFGKWSFDNSR